MDAVSDRELFDFYQRPLSYLAYAEGDMPYAVMNEDDVCDITWHCAAFSALTRLALSGLVGFGADGNPEKTLVDLSMAFHAKGETGDPYLAGSTWLPDWVLVIVESTSQGVSFAKEHGLLLDAEVLVPGFREALSRIFDEHGVGFDAELPYRMQV